MSLNRLGVLLPLLCLTGVLASIAPYRVTETSVAVLHPNGKLLTFSGSATVRELLGALVNKEGCELHAAEGQSVYSGDSLVMWAFSSEQAGSEATHKITCDGSKADAALVMTRYEMPNVKSMLKNPSKSDLKPQGPKPNAPREYPFEFIEIMGDTIESDLAWAKSFAENHWGKMHPFPTYQGTQETGVYHLNTGAVVRGRPTPSPVDDQEVRIGLAADWGAGTRESDYVQQLMVKDWNPHWTLHLGDVYYVGAPEQMKSNVLGVPPANTQKGVKWPVGSLGSFALNGNHEMYSRGFGYFDVWFPALGIKNQATGQMNGQKASYVALENAYYRLIHLDTGYGTYSPVFENDNNPQPQAVMDWLTNVVKLGDPSDTRAIVFLSHHQFRSAWESGYRATAEQLAKLLPPGRTVLWLWGHEHRLSFYNSGVFENVTLSHYARCVGVSGFPVSINAIPKDPRGSNLVAYDKREYAIAKGTLTIPVGFNGYMRITLKGASMQADYYSLKLDQSGKVSNQTADLLVTETWKANGLGDIQLTNFTIVNPNITVVQHYLGENDKGKLTSKPLW